MEKFIFYGMAVLAGYFAICPRGRKPPCPDPIAKSLSGLVFGATAAVAYALLFVGKRALEGSDLFAVALIAFLFSHFVWTLLFTKREA